MNTLVARNTDEIVDGLMSQLPSDAGGWGRWELNWSLTTETRTDSSWMILRVKPVGPHPASIKPHGVVLGLWRPTGMVFVETEEGTMGEGGIEPADIPNLVAF